MKRKEDLIEKIRNKKILYIATKNEDYIRISQEILLLTQYGASVKVITCKEKGYLKRVLKVYKMLCTTSVKDFDCIFIGFMAQMILPIWGFRFRKKEIFVDFFISVYDTLIFDRKKFSENGLIARIVKYIDRITLNRADYFICDTEEHGKYFSDEFGKSREDGYVMYLEADEKIYYKRIQKKPENWKDKFLVLYFGSILPVQGVDIVIEAMGQLNKETDIQFVVIGPIGKKIKKIYSENIEYIDWLEQERLAEYIAAADLCLAGHFSDCVNKAKRTIPGKAYIYEMMGKSMILGDSPANHELFLEDKRHTFVTMGDAENLADTILLKRNEWNG